MANLRARQLRKLPTEIENRLWYHLRRKQLGGRFRRQHPFGRYVVDFACLESRLVVEVDGGQHAERQDHDAVRGSWPAERGYRVLRFWNVDVIENPSSVLDTILDALGGPLADEA